MVKDEDSMAYISKARVCLPMFAPPGREVR